METLGFSSIPKLQPYLTADININANDLRRGSRTQKQDYDHEDICLFVLMIVFLALRSSAGTAPLLVFPLPFITVNLKSLSWPHTRYKVYYGIASLDFPSPIYLRSVEEVPVHNWRTLVYGGRKSSFGLTDGETVHTWRERSQHYSFELGLISPHFNRFPACQAERCICNEGVSQIPSSTAVGVHLPPC